MLRNYLVIAIRNFRKQKLFSFINILSLTIGLAASMLIYLFVTDELSFDKFNTNYDTIYRVIQVQNQVDGSIDYKGTHHSIGLATELAREIPEVIHTARFYKDWRSHEKYVRANGKTILEPVLYGDFTTFNMFTFPILHGSTDSESPYEVVVSRDLADKFFERTDVAGEIVSIRIDDTFVDFVVVGVAENIPSNSSVQFDLLINFSYLTEVGWMKEFKDDWGFGAIRTYVQTRNAIDSRILPVLDKILATHYPYYESIAEQRGYDKTRDYRHLEFQALSEIHFDTGTSSLEAPSNRMYSIVLSAIALGILLIGSINFMNLSMGRSSNRIKEIGLRKSIGASQHQLIRQFLGESVLMSICALVLAIFLVDLFLPVFNQITGKEIGLAQLFNPVALALVVSFAIVTGCISGFYPAFVLSRFTFDDAISGRQRYGKSNLFTRSLVVVQFMLSAILIVGMIVVTSQMHFIHNKDLGFKGDQVVIIPNHSFHGASVLTHYRNTLLSGAGIENISSADQSFGSPSGLGGMGFEYRGTPMRIGIINVQSNYLETLGIDLVKGRSFDENRSTEYTDAVIVNEAAFRDFELALNEPFEGLGRQGADPLVVGVMKDFNYKSLMSEVEPMLIRLSNDVTLDHVLVKISPEHIDESLASLKTAWTEIAKDVPFTYSFLDDTMSDQYADQQRWSTIIQISMITAIILSCLGLFGMVAMAIASKRSEIGIRKVLGARVTQIVTTYGSTYLTLVGISFLLAVPISYVFFERWLETFAYRINIGVTVYAISLGLLLVLAVLTILYKIIEAAVANPVNVLREE